MNFLLSSFFNEILKIAFSLCLAMVGGLRSRYQVRSRIKIAEVSGVASCYKAGLSMRIYNFNSSVLDMAQKRQHIVLIFILFLILPLRPSMKYIQRFEILLVLILS